MLTFAGMKPSSAPTVLHSAAAFASGDAALVAELRHLQFVAGVAEQLQAPGNPNRFGLSQVVQLSSAANATAALRYYHTSNGPWTVFTVSGIPGAVGFEQSAEGQGGRNIGFVVGRFFYLVGDGWQNGAKNAIPSSTLQAAGLRLYNRVR
ncbi:MAG: hypothetical protein ACRDLP_09530 [Solirubrobacteraceae bacterium]